MRYRLLPAQLSHRAPTLLSLGLAFAASLTGLPAAAQSCDRSGCGFATCATPATPVPSTFWQEIQPADNSFTLCTNTGPAFCRDSTGFNDEAQAYANFPWFMGVDTANGFVMTALAYGMEIWDARTTPASPTPLGSVSVNAFPNPPSNPEIKWPLQSVALPSGVDTVAALASQSSVGLVIVNTSDKTLPRVAYQNYGKEGQQVYAATLGGHNFAFLAAASGAPEGGVFMYDMTNALAYDHCSEGVPATGAAVKCPGVFIGQLGDRIGVSYVAGVGNYLVLSSGATHGFEIWDVSTPSEAVLKLSGLPNNPVYGVAMWTSGGKIYLGLRTDVDGRIYDVSCLPSGCTSGLGNALAIRTLDSGTTNFYVTYSLSGSTPFLYFGSDNRCGGGGQREWLFDVTNPSSPRDVSPQNNYWGWYYRGNPTGFNDIMPRTGKFVGNQFYRMALSLFDIHTWNSNGNPSPSLFINGPDSGAVNTPITFTADAAICSPNPSGYSWNPAGGTIVGSANGSSVQISWSGAGLDEVSVTNSACGTARGVHSINVVSGGNTPLTAHFTSSPSAPQPGQQISFDASSSSGGPTDFSWSFGDGTGGSGEVTTHTYPKAGNYDLTLTISGPGTGPSCPAGICTAQTFRVIAVGQPPTPTAAFTTDLPCKNLFGFDECQVQVGHSGTFSASDSGPFTYAWDFGDGGKATGQTASHTWTTVGLVTMELAVSNGQEPVISTKLINVTSGPPPCTESDTSLCTLTSRFQLTVNWTAPSGGGSGAGHAVSLSDDTGYFWFFNLSNVEMVAKVLDGCAVNHKFWVFAGGLTNVQTDLIVTDTLTGATKTYHNPQGTPFQPLQDTAAFDCGSSTAFPAAASPETTAPPSTDLQLDSGRFLVSAAWTQPGGQTGTGQGVPLTTDTGYFWFFNSANVEMVIKVLNACGVNDKYWVFAGGLTNVKVVVTVTDTSNGTVKTYTNPQGVAFAPIQDTSAFATCP